MRYSKMDRYSMTSLAVASNLSGPVKPSVFAVLRLMTKLNLVGCCTSISAGFSPTEYAADINSRQTKGLADVVSIAHQASGRRVFTPLSYARNSVPSC